MNIWNQGRYEGVWGVNGKVLALGSIGYMELPIYISTHNWHERGWLYYFTLLVQALWTELKEEAEKRGKEELKQVRTDKEMNQVDCMRLIFTNN